MPTTDVSRRAGLSIDSRRDRLARDVVERYYAAEPQAWPKYGRQGWRKGIEDAKFHFTYLAQALKTGAPRIFTDYSGWVKSLFHHLRLPSDHMETVLQFMLEALRDTLDTEDFAVTAEYVQQALAAAAPLPDEPFVDDTDTLAPLARQYLELLLMGRRTDAISAITEAADNGTPIKDLYLRVLQPVMRETGRLWHINQLDVNQEHYISAATQIAMSRLYPYAGARHKKRRLLIAACVPNELHDIGLRMVSDFFDLDGWNSYHIGANVPEESIASAVAFQRADVLALSVTMTFNLAPLEQIIERVRNSQVIERVRVIVGGFPLQTFPDLWRQLDADGTAADAQAAVDLANLWMDSET